MLCLPIDEVLPALRSALSGHSATVLQAPPGAGKTTRVPLALLDESWLAGRRIVMLEPRRLAASASARQMARQLDESVGQTVGYRIRFESKISAQTRIEVVTEGILTRRLQSDPELSGVGLVIFDEFHERSLNTDLALALCLESQQALRPDLKLLVMSATLDAAPVAALLGDAPLVTSEGRSFPVQTHYLDREPDGRLDATVLTGIRRALRDQQGDILAFLPGAGEIRAVAERLAEEASPELKIAPLYGDLGPEAQAEALEPSPDGRRKVVLATSIAETSLTIPGIRVVVDGGYSRLPVFDPVSGMTRLTTQRVSLASADQRRGRAGRLAAGVCYRLWSEGIQAGLAKQTVPEIRSADLAPLMLELAVWGVSDPYSLAWLDPPVPAAVAQARELLQALGALDRNGRVTVHGRAMAELAVHPRLAHMVLRGQALGYGDTACLLAGLFGERDILRGLGKPVDVALRVHALRALERKQALSGEVDRGAARRVLDAARQFRRRLGIDAGAPDDEDAWLGVLLAQAYPDRIAQARPGSRGRFLLSGGRGALIPEADALASAAYLAVAELDGQAREAKVFLAAELRLSDLERYLVDDIEIVERVGWDDREQAVLARREWRLGELVLKTEALSEVDAGQVAAGLCAGIRQLGLSVLPWTEEARDWLARARFLHRQDPESWPDCSDEALLAGLEDWLAPHLAGFTRLSHLSRLKLAEILASRLDWNTQQRFQALAPSHLQVPTGSRIRLDYPEDGSPVLAVRLQELFGQAQTPTVGRGVPVRLHLLSPAHRPVAVTDDLARFWRVGYPDVKKDMKGRYPKHYWPDNPLEAEPTTRAKPRGT